MNIILVEFIVYCLIIVLIGYYFMRVTKSQSDFLLGGNKIPGWVLAFSERATGESAWLLLGYTGFVYASGLSAIWVAVGIAIGIIFAWLFLSKRFMRETKKYNVLTIPDYLAVRFGEKAALIRWFAGILIAGFMIFYVAAQLAGTGKLLLTTFDLHPIYGVLLAAVVIVLTSLTGGFISVVWTDMVQSILMITALVVLPIVAFIYIFTNDLSVTHALTAAGDSFTSWFGGLTGFSLGVLFFNNFSWFFGYLGGQPQLSSRFMAMKNEKEANIGITVGILWTIIAYTGAFLIGLAAIVLFPQETFDDVETVLPALTLELLPPWISGILLAGILAAILSTANSQLLVVTSSVTEDIMHKAIGMKLTDRQLVRISRISILIFGVIGVIIALVSESLVYLVVSWAWAGIGCTLSPAILLTFFWKRYSSTGVIATILSGLLSTILWISTPLEEMITSRFTTFVIAMIFGIVFSLLFPDQKDDADTNVVVE